MITCEECGVKYHPLTDAYKCPECGTENYPEDEDGVELMTINQIAEDAINLFLEYRDVHGFEDEDVAKAKALNEVSEGTAEEQRRLDTFPELLAALERLDDAADAFRADQGRATDTRVGLVQPVTVAECDELNAASKQARAILAKAKGI